MHSTQAAAKGVDHFAEHGEALSEATIHMTTLLKQIAAWDDSELALPSPAANHVLFIWLNCCGMRDLLRPMPNAVAVSALARSIQEAYIGLFYFCVEEVDSAESAMRAALWKKHVHGKHVELTKSLPDGMRSPEVSALIIRHEDGLASARDALKTNDCVRAIAMKNPGYAGKLVNEVNEYLAEHRSEIWRRSGLGATFRDSWTMFSQAAHATPWTIDGLTRGGPLGDAGRERIQHAILVALICLAKGAEYVAQMRPQLRPLAAAVMKASYSLVPRLPNASG